MCDEPPNVCAEGSEKAGLSLTLIHNKMTARKKKEPARREGSVLRDNKVHEHYDTLIEQAGDYKFALSKSWYYQQLAKAYRLSVRTISYIINHTKKHLL